MNIKLSAANVVSIIILMCILAACIDCRDAVVRTVEDIGQRFSIGELSSSSSDYSYNVNYPR